MAESLDIFRYISYLRLRWKWIGGSCLVAVSLAIAVSLTLPRQYTATARILIEPPAGSDRTSMAVSPIYLESLKTYEQFAGSDSLFQKAVDRFQLRTGGSIEGLKKRVLRVGVVRNTRVLEISSTLPDPRRSQELAKFLAESTVDLSRALVTESDQELLQGVDLQEQQVRSSLENIETVWARLQAEEPVGELQASLNKSGELRAVLQTQILNTQLEIADAAQRQQSGAAADQAEASKESANASARLDEMRKQLAGLEAQSKEQERTLAIRMTHRDKLEADRKAAQSALAAIASRSRDAHSESGYRGERLRVIDPGVVPERPSSPNLPLNVMAALLLGLTLPILYLMLELNYQEKKISARRAQYQPSGPAAR